ncbi:MAG: hypothetical protein DI629_14175 [Mesorhizobium amorphae]|nr:MAG: hypothetical protein DI629_14175 [Mesorhizobium amorphae]
MRQFFSRFAGLAFLTMVAGAASSGTTAAAACEAGDPSLAGRYDLKNVMNVGSRVTLKANGSFDYRLTYGAVNQRGAGCWSREGDVLVLMPNGATAISSTPALERTQFAGVTLQVDGSALEWDIAGNGRMVRYERR